MLWKAVLLVAFASTCTGLLRQLTVVFRHGERTPASTYKNDIYKNEKFYPFGWGQLTNKGKLHQYEQGQWLRRKYGDFLGNILTQTLIESASTYPPRAQMSMSLMLAGLMPPSEEQIWNKNLSWQPFPWTSTGDEVDRLLLATKCPRIQEAIEEIEKSNEEIEYNKENAELYSYLSLHTGENIKTPADVFDIQGTLHAEQGYGIELPQWTKSVFPDKMDKVAEHHFILFSKTKELRRLTGGRLVKKIIETSKSKIDKKQDHPKMIAYSGHDSTVVNLLRALGIWDEQVPGYNIMTIFELHEAEGNDPNWTMKVMLKNSTTEEPHTLTVPGCTEECPFDNFLKLTNDIIPQDLEMECKTLTKDFKPEKQDRGP